MVKTCCVYKCRNRANSDAKSKNISFFRFPANKRKLQAWIRSVNRKDWKPNSHTHVCSEHFVCGWHSDDPSEVNYAPTLFDHKDNRKNKNGETTKDKEPINELEKHCLGENSKDTIPCNNLKDIHVATDQTVDTEISTESTDQPYSSVQQNVLLDYPDPLKDHLYCKQLPWPGKKQTKTKLTKAKISRESAAETLLTLCEMHVSKSSDSIVETSATNTSLCTLTHEPDIDAVL